MPNKGDFGGFQKGFLQRDQKKDKGKSPESSKKLGQLSTGDQQLVFMGVDQKKYHEELGQAMRETFIGDQARQQDVKGKQLDRGQGKTPWDKWELTQVGGKARLENAKEIFVGFQHLEKGQRNRVVNAINSIAQEGDIILLEGAEAGKELDRNEYPDLSSKFRLIGWDDMKAFKQGEELLKIEGDLVNKVEKARSKEEFLDAKCQLNTFQKSIYDLVVGQRNKSLDTTHDKIRQQYPDSRIITVGGAVHFAPSSILRDRFEAQTAVLFMPRDTVDRIKTSQTLSEWFQQN